MRKAYFWLALSLILAAGMAIAWYRADDQHHMSQEALMRSRIEANKLREDIKGLELRLAKLNEQSQIQEEKINTEQHKSIKANAILAQVRQDLNASQEEVRASKQRADDLQSHNDALKSELIKACSEIPSISQAAQQNYEEQIHTLSQEISYLKKYEKIVKNEASVETDVSPTQNTASATILKADFDNAFLILDCGSEKGLHNGMEIAIAKGYEAPIALKLVKVEPYFSLASFSPGKIYTQLQERDLVVIIKESSGNYKK